MTIRPTIKDEILDIIRRKPGLSSINLYRELGAQRQAERHKHPIRAFLGLLGPSLGSMWVALAELEERGVISSCWGDRGKSGHRLRRYYIGSQAHQ